MRISWASRLWRPLWEKAQNAVGVVGMTLPQPVLSGYPLFHVAKR